MRHVAVYEIQALSVRERPSKYGAEALKRTGGIESPVRALLRGLRPQELFDITDRQFGEFAPSESRL